MFEKLRVAALRPLLSPVSVFKPAMPIPYVLITLLSEGTLPFSQVVLPVAAVEVAIVVFLLSKAMPQVVEPLTSIVGPI